MLGERFGPFLSRVSQAVRQPDPLPRQQAVGSDLVKQGGVEDVVGGLGHHQAAAQEVEIIQRHQETWRGQTKDGFVIQKTRGGWRKTVQGV